MDTWSGKEIAGYRLGERLDAGRLGARFRAEGAGVAGPVAVRVIPPPTADDRWFADRVARGLRPYVGIAGVGLAPILATGAEGGAAYAVLPLAGADGTATLRARLGRPLPPAAVVALLGPVAAALDALHERRLPHGDVRPERIALAEDGATLLCEAGIAAVADDAARLSPGGPTLTVEEAVYRAPECAHGLPADPRADLYSLGVVAYEALVGRPPFTAAEAGGSDEALMNRHVGIAPPAPRALNPALGAATEAALLAALEKSPYARPASAGAFLDALAAGAGVARAQPAPVPHPGAGDRGASIGSPAPPTLPTPPAPLPVWLAPATRASAAPVAEPTATPTPATIAAPRSISGPAPATASYTPPSYAPPPPPPIAAPPPPTYVPSAAQRPAGTYTYESPPALAMPPRPDDALALRAARGRLVDTLAALGTRRARELRGGRAELVGTLRSLAPASPPPPPAAAPPRRPVAPASAARARQQPAAPARRYTSEFYREFRNPPMEVARAQPRSSGAITLAVLLVIGLFNSNTRCLVPMATVGFLVVGLVWRRDTERVIGCDQQKFTVETGVSPGSRVVRTHAWEEISGLRYEERGSGNTRRRPMGHFIAEVGGNQVFDQTDEYPGYEFARLVSLFGQMTPHLPYVWIPATEAGAAAAMGRRFVRVPRGAAGTEGR